VVTAREPGGGTFTVRHGTATDHHTSWEAPLSVVSAANYRPGMTSSAWVAVYGGNFTSNARSWRDEEIVEDQLPTELDGVRVAINGKPAAVSYIGPRQINAQVPTDDTLGPVQVRVTTRQVTTTAIAPMREFSPGLFTFDDGTGFGRTVPATPAGQIVRQAAPLANRVTIRIGNRLADVQWAGRVAAGLDQFNVVVPEDLPEGDAAVVAEIGGFRSPDGPLLTIQRPSAGQ
jgi:hypothetical protein